MRRKKFMKMKKAENPRTRVQKFGQNQNLKIVNLNKFKHSLLYIFIRSFV